MTAGEPAGQAGIGRVDGEVAKIEQGIGVGAKIGEKLVEGPLDFDW